VFCYGILASALSLFEHTAAYSRLSATTMKAWGTCKQRLVYRRNSNVCRERCRWRTRPQSRRMKTMHVTQLYVAGTLDIAIISSFGFSYPLVSLAGLIRLVLQAYAMRAALPVVSTIGGRRLQMEGTTGLPLSAMVAVLAVNMTMYFSIFGPKGMMQLTTFEWLAPLVTGTVGMVSIPWIVRWWSGRHNEQGDVESHRKNSMEMPLRRGRLGGRSLEEEQEERELTACTSFEESFREWRAHETAAVTTVDSMPGCRKNRGEDGGEYTVL